MAFWGDYIKRLSREERKKIQFIFRFRYIFFIITLNFLSLLEILFDTAKIFIVKILFYDFIVICYGKEKGEKFLFNIPCFTLL